jgi:hypothetical protein
LTNEDNVGDFCSELRALLEKHQIDGGDFRDAVQMLGADLDPAEIEEILTNLQESGSYEGRSTSCG